MRDILTFIVNNKVVLIGLLVGLAAGFIHWYYFACYWGTYPLSSECWVNCCYGTILGGFIATLIKKE